MGSKRLDVLLVEKGIVRAEVESFLLQHHPTLWKPLLKLLSYLGFILE